MLAASLSGSVTILCPRFSENAVALAPVFTRPNTLVDAGPGWVGTGSPGGPVIASDRAGKLHAAWMDNRTGELRIYYSNSVDGGATWQGETTVDFLPGMGNMAPSIAVDTSSGPYSGYVYVAWQSMVSGSFDIYVIRSTDGGTTWNVLDRHKLDNALPNSMATAPRVTVGTDGWVYVAFQDNRNGNLDIFVTESSDGGAAWLTEKRVASDTNNKAHASISASGSFVVVAWEESNASATSLWSAISADNGNLWQVSLVVSVPSGSGGVSYPSILIESSGRIHAVWIMLDAGNANLVMYAQSVDFGTSWIGTKQVNDVFLGIPYSPNGLTITQSSGVLYVVWSDNRYGDYDVFCSWSENNGNKWGDGLLNNNDVRVDDTDDVVPDNTDQTSPSTAPGLFGIYAIWSDMRNGVARHAYFASFDVSEMLITEIRDSPNGFEQVELFNHGSRNINLAGWGLIVDGVRFDLTPLGIVAPGAYFTVGDSVSSTLSVDITLGDEGGYVRLLNQLSVVKDSVYYGQLGPVPDPIASESTARVQSGSGYSASWVRDATPTFGAPNGGMNPATNPSFIFNEVLFNAANPNNRFIELYFKGLGTFDTSGYTVVGDSAYTLPATILSDANPFYLIRPSQAPALFSTLTATGDNLYLYDTNGVFYDMVGWSTAHTQDLSMTRVPDGFGTAEGYNDTSSIAAGWRFDRAPSMPLVLIGPGQRKWGDFGTRVFYVLTVTNKELTNSYANIQTILGPQGWAMSLFKADGVTPLPDSPGDADSTPDTGLLPPEGQVNIQVSVDIPPTPQVHESEVGTVVATIAGDPLSGGNVLLTTEIYPYLSPTAFSNPSAVWVETSPPAYTPKETTMTLTVTGRGMTLSRQRPQDTVFMIDTSGSMLTSDPFDLRLDAAAHYVDLLSIPDRAAVLCYDEDVMAPNGDHLSSNYSRIKSNVDYCQTDQMNTNLYDPIRLATDEILAYGNQSHTWVEILLTDGQDTTGHSDLQIVGEAQRAANEGIVIFTIGLNESGSVDEMLLREIAKVSGGLYLRAQTANDLDSIYQAIGDSVRNLAGYDDNVTDDIPMINLFLPSYIHYVPGTANPPPSYTGSFAGNTNVQWNLSKLSINETWTATLNVTSSLSGNGVAALSAPDSIVSYIRYDDTRINFPFPQTLIDVLAPSVAVNVTITRSPVLGNVIVEGFSYPAPVTFQWLPGEVRTISAPDPDVISPGERWLFVSWDDGGALTHDITIGNSDMTFTAIYSRQFKPVVDLMGTDSVHGVNASFTSIGVPVIQIGVFATWSDWLDANTALSFDTLAIGSNLTARWITPEDFSIAPWIQVTSAFSRSVTYRNQFRPVINLIGLSAVHGVTALFTAMGQPVTQPGQSSAWSDWVDANTALSFDAQGAGSNQTERWITQESFNALPWVQVISPFSRSIVYYHQVTPVVVLQEIIPGGLHQGLPSTFAVQIHFVEFGLSGSADANDSWSDWVDNDTLLSIVMPAAMPYERFINMVSKDLTTLEFTVTGINTIAIPFIHQFKPTVYLLGTDSEHTVGLSYNDSSGDQVQVHLLGLSGSWSDWADEWSFANFSGSTTGSPPLYAVNETNLIVDSAFTAVIIYNGTPPITPPANPEANFKPLISVFFVIILIVLGIVLGRRKPWDRYIPPAKSVTKPEEMAKREMELKKMPIAQKLKLLTPAELKGKFTYDRRWTMTMLALPFAAVEGTIGVSSLITGILRVPEDGNWISLGVIVNSMLLLAGIAFDLIMQRFGYNVPTEAELVTLKSADTAKEGTAKKIKKKTPGKMTEQSRSTDSSESDSKKVPTTDSVGNRPSEK
jgi:hypothetical protein